MYKRVYWLIQHHVCRHCHRVVLAHANQCQDTASTLSTLSTRCRRSRGCTCPPLCPTLCTRGELLARVHALSVSVTLVWVTRRSARPPDKPLGAGAPCRVADVGCRVRGRVEQGLAAHAKRHAPRVLKSSHKRPLLHPRRGPQIAPKVLGDRLDTGAALGDPTLPTAGQSHRPRVSLRGGPHMGGRPRACL